MRKHMAVVMVFGVLVLALSACAKKPQTATQAAPFSDARPEAASPPEEVLAPPMIGEAQPSPLTPALTTEAALLDVYFEFDRAEITPAARTAIEQNAKWLSSRPNVMVRIEGHADERGTNEYNLALGEQRAQAVKRMLSALGVSVQRLSTITYGEEQPVCRDHAEMCWQKNRRAHFGVL